MYQTSHSIKHIAFIAILSAIMLIVSCSRQTAKTSQPESVQSQPIPVSTNPNPATQPGQQPPAVVLGSPNDKSKGGGSNGIMASQSPSMMGLGSVGAFKSAGVGAGGGAYICGGIPANFNREEYAFIKESGYQRAKDNPLSTFSIDVDAASYSNVRRFLQEGRLPPADAVRVEELINYFPYEYANPTGNLPCSITTTLVECPWKKSHYLLHIGIKAKPISLDNSVANNLVFLLDVSGSMGEPNKLPLVKRAFRILVDQLRPQDRIAIVTYAGESRLALASTKGTDKGKILEAIDELYAGGCTNGAGGITLAYKTAKDNFQSHGNNRVILATDGDFNVGVSSQGELVRLIEEKRRTGIFLTVLGFGQGNLQDSKMENLADKGNGQYHYIDNILEARKVFVNELGGTLVTVAKDVKIQVEFNPDKVQAYRLVGYENRMLRSEEFNDDKKDAGDMGAGHTVTALYEFIPAGVETELPGVDLLRYTQVSPKKSTDLASEWLYVKLRYKEPDSESSKLISKPVTGSAVALNQAPGELRFAASVAAFGMLLRKSEYREDASFSMVLELARSGFGSDRDGYRHEFIRLAETAESLMKSEPVN